MSLPVSLSPADLGYRGHQEVEAIAYKAEQIENGGMGTAIDTILATYFPVVKDPGNLFAHPIHLTFLEQASKIKKQEETPLTVAQKPPTKRRLPLCCTSGARSKSPQNQ